MSSVTLQKLEMIMSRLDEWSKKSSMATSVRQTLEPLIARAVVLTKQAQAYCAAEHPVLTERLQNASMIVIKCVDKMIEEVNMISSQGIVKRGEVIRSYLIESIRLISGHFPAASNLIRSQIKFATQSPLQYKNVRDSLFNLSRGLVDLIFIISEELQQQYQNQQQQNGPQQQPGAAASDAGSQSKPAATATSNQSSVTPQQNGNNQQQDEPQQQQKAESQKQAEPQQQSQMQSQQSKESSQPSQSSDHQQDQTMTAKPDQSVQANDKENYDNDKDSANNTSATTQKQNQSRSPKKQSQQSSSSYDKNNNNSKQNKSSKRKHAENIGNRS